LALQRTAGNHAVTQLLARSGTGTQVSPQKLFADAVKLQRQASPASSHLQSPRFSPSAKLERCLEDTDRLREADPDTDAVKRIQQALIDVKKLTGKTYDLGSTGPSNDGVDGDYGPKTAAAVRKFKADETLGFTQFGDVGPGTMRRLDELFSAGKAPPATPLPKFKVPRITPEPVEGRCKVPTNPDLSGKEFNPSTMGEERACASVGLDVCLAARDDAKEASKEADRSGLPGTPFGPRDALRHSLWNCLMTQDTRIALTLAGRSEIAERFATAHEIDATGSPSELDTSMDFHNNATGRRLAVRGEDCLAECKRALRQGELRTMRGLEADGVARQEKLPPASPTVVPSCLGASDQPWP
jgi:peptidoglycan hydrolase-like protein with peptidoglycan-binding domain